LIIAERSRRRDAKLLSARKVLSSLFQLFSRNQGIYQDVDFARLTVFVISFDAVLAE